MADNSPATDIRIKESRVGTFTAAATAHHMSVQQFASHVLSNKDQFTARMERKAQFAKNASKFNNGHPG
jgi:hypothetical protein